MVWSQLATGLQWPHRDPRPPSTAPLGARQRYLGAKFIGLAPHCFNCSAGQPTRLKLRHDSQCSSEGERGEALRPSAGRPEIRPLSNRHRKGPARFDRGTLVPDVGSAMCSRPTAGSDKLVLRERVAGGGRFRPSRVGDSAIG